MFVKKKACTTMAIDALVKPLLKVELFRGLRPLQITEIARRSFRTVYKPGDTIIASDEAGEYAVLIVSGRAVRVAAPGEIGLNEALPEGALLGEMAMLIETTHSSTVVAETPVRALRIARSELHEQMADDRSLADHFMQRIRDRLVVMADELRRIDGALAQSDAMIDGMLAGTAHRPSGGEAGYALH